MINKDNLKVSQLAQHLKGSEIINIANEVKKLMSTGVKVNNLTIGDFNPEYFPIPDELKEYIIEAYRENYTNYPTANGELVLRQSISRWLKDRKGIAYNEEEILVSAGARPIIYSIYATIVDPTDTVIFAVPSWNNNHYAYLNGAKSVVIEGKPENKFMPSAADIKPAIETASLVALCSPQNPTGTMFTKKGLEEICDLILVENNRRSATEKPVYLMFDQIYWELTMGETVHYNPVELRPEMKDYTLFIDGISKSLSATGVRVGWGYGPEKVISKMKSLLTHVGAWSPKAEQLATAKFLNNKESYERFIDAQREKIYSRLKGLYDGFQSLKNEGFTVDAIAPQAAIYLTVKIDLKGKRTLEGNLLASTKEVTNYILHESKLAVVPFYAFGTHEDSPWYRISVGTCAISEIELIIENLRTALRKLKD